MQASNVDKRQLDEQTIRGVAELQAAVLPTSLISRLGTGFVREFYRFANRSPKEIVLWRSDDSGVVGVCVVSLDPGSLTRRLLFQTSLAFRLLRLPIRTLLRQLMPASNAADKIGDMPELILLFTRAEKRSQGIGSQLVMECESQLARRGVRKYYVKTFDAEGDRAVAFYLREGFEDCGAHVVFNERFRFLSRTVRSAPSN